MDLRQLKYFLHAAEMQSLSRAAEQLRVAQSALSRHIKNLEEELAVALLHRHGWGVTPTPAGELLMDHARVLLKDLDAARNAVRAYQDEPSGTLAFGVPSSLSRMLLPELAVRFRRRAPKVRLHLVDGFSATIHDWLVQGRLDLAILYETKTMDGLVTTPLITDEMMLVGSIGTVSETGAVDLPSVSRLDLILPARPHRLRLLIDQAFSRAGVPVTPVIEVDALTALTELVRRGEGFTLLPWSSVQDMVRSGALSAATVAPAIHRSLVFARQQAQTLTPAIAALESEIQRLVDGAAHERVGRNDP